MPYGKISFDYQVVNQSAKVTVPFIYYLGYQATIQMKNKRALKNEPNQSRRLNRSFFIWYRTCRHPLPKNKSAKIGTMITLLSVGGFGFSRFLQQKETQDKRTTMKVGP